ncbi:MAG: trypsin-like peptidase domain-containing protein [Prosthecobacter sp.]
MSLLKFLFTEKCTNCGERIEKAAKFCRHCGAGRADSWRKCNTCGVSVAADSQFCWSCKANVAAQPRDEIFSDRWRRTPGVFATRVTIETPQDRLRNGIQVDEGTRGALYSNGALKAELGAGYHSQTSFWDRLTGGGKSAGFLETIITVADSVSSMVSFSSSASLYTKDSSPVEAAVLVKVQLDDFAVFARRMLPAGSDTVRDDDLMQPHSARVAEVLRRHLSRLDVTEVARSTELRHEIEAALGAELPGLLQEYGLRYRGVEDVRLDSPQISRVREAEGGHNQTERELTWAKKRRELEQTHKLAEFKDDFAFREQLDRWTHEYALTNMEREHIVNMRRIQQQKELELADIHRVGGGDLARQQYEHEKNRRETDSDMEELAKVRDMQRTGWDFKMRMDRDKLALQAELQQKQAEFRQKQAEHDVEMERRRVDALRGAEPHIAAAVLPTEKGNQVIRTLETLRPLPDVIIISSHHHAPPHHGHMPMPGYQMPQPSYMPSYMPGAMPGPSFMPGPAPSGYPGPGTHGGTSLEILAQRYLPSVGVVVAGIEMNNPIPLGTAWIAAGRGVVITNAHVAEAAAQAHAEASMGAWVIFSGQSQPCRVRRALIHPEYALSQDRGYPIPSFDVAVLELETPPPHAGLPLANRGKLLSLRELQSVAYLGFPMENLAGGGTNLERPKAIAKKGSISSLEDWHMRHADDPAQRQLIKHDLGVAGGASGSPLFDEAGDVVGVISAGNMEQL